MAGLIAAASAVLLATLAAQAPTSPDTFSISGRLESSRGGFPRGLAVTVHAPTEDGTEETSCEMLPDGRFVAHDLPPGTYVLEAAPPAWQGERPIGVERGVAAVTVGDGDVTDVVITTGLGVTVRGRVRLDMAQPGSPAPDSIVVHAALALTEWLGPSESAAVADDGTFELRDVVGPRVFRAVTGPGRLRGWWTPGTVLLDGRDITNEPIYPGTEPIGEVVFHLTQNPSTILGRVEDVAGLTTPGACVVLLPEDPGLRRGWSTAVGTAEADRRGRFYFTALPSGEYIVAAFEATECPSRGEAVAQARALARGGTRVAVTEGATVRVLVTAATVAPRP